MLGSRENEIKRVRYIDLFIPCNKVKPILELWPHSELSMVDE